MGCLGDAVTEPFYRIQGGVRLNGRVRISGAKNAATPCMAAALLTTEPCRITNAPQIEDVALFAGILRSLGAEVVVDPDAHSVEIRAPRDLHGTPPDHIVANQRASFLVMGPLLARRGNCACAAPGGDVIGQRPLDVHLTGFTALGATVRADGGRFQASAARLYGARVVLDYPSVLGTENLMLAAALADGRTTIVNAAAEPEVLCLATMLRDMGARIDGAGTHTLVIDGVETLHGTSHALIPDRIEAGTFAVASAMTGGDVLLAGANPRHMDATLSKLGEIGVGVTEEADGVRVQAAQPLRASNVQAVPYPGLATDLQGMLVALLTQADGVSVINERVFENRLQYVGELRKLGARIVTAGTTAIVQGPTPLRGTVVRGLDIRASAVLVAAALAAEGQTELLDIQHLERGYERFDAKLRDVGASVYRVEPAAAEVAPAGG